MPRRPAMLTQADVARAIRAVQQQGIVVGRVDIDAKTGKVSIYPKGQEPPEEAAVDTWAGVG